MTKLVTYIISYVLLALLVIAAAILSPLQFMGYFSYKRIQAEAKAPDYVEGDPITLMSANIRRQEKLFSGDKADTGSHRWWKRAKYFLENVHSVKPDILGCQEVQPKQYEFLSDHLRGYRSVVTYRDKRKGASESCPIFYNAKRFSLLESGTFWLSETPTKMSKSWGSAHYRICTFVVLKDKDGTTFSVYNTHPDWDCAEARVKQIEVIAKKVKERGGKAIVLGDLNSVKGTENGDAALSSLEEILKDSKDFNGGVSYGDTFNDYGGSERLPLDYIYLPADANVLSVGKVDKVYDGVYPSDHFPIFAKIKF